MKRGHSTKNNYHSYLQTFKVIHTSFFAKQVQFMDLFFIKLTTKDPHQIAAVIFKLWIFVLYIFNETIKDVQLLTLDFCLQYFQ